MKKKSRTLPKFCRRACFWVEKKNVFNEFVLSESWLHVVERLRIPKCTQNKWTLLSLTPSHRRHRRVQSIIENEKEGKSDGKCCANAKKSEWKELLHIFATEIKMHIRNSDMSEFLLGIIYFDLFDRLVLLWPLLSIKKKKKTVEILMTLFEKSQFANEVRAKQNICAHWSSQQWI